MSLLDRNPLINIDRCAYRSRRERVDKLKLQTQTTIEFRLERSEEALGVVVREAGGRDGTESCDSGTLLEKLEPEKARVAIVVDVEGRPGDEAPIRGDQHFLSPMSTNVRDDGVDAAARVALFTNVDSGVAGTIANEGNHRVDEAGADNLATLPRSSDWPIGIVE